VPQTELKTEAVGALLKESTRLPSLPAIAVRILEIVKKDKFSLSELADVIKADPALAASVLRVANSAFYCLRSEVSSIEKALLVVGSDAVKNVALSFIISKDLKGQGEGCFDFDFFWKRSITAAVAAELIASLVKSRDDSTFISALLQDIGIIAMYYCKTNDYLRVLDERRLTGMAVDVVENQVFGFDHQELGYEILNRWGLPEKIAMPIRFHHRPEQVPDKYSLQANILHLSDRISSIYNSSMTAGKLREITDILSQRFAIQHADVVSLIDNVAEESLEIFAEFEVDPGNMRPLSQILQEANEELSSLNLSYEMLVVELKQAKEKAEKFARELRSANEALRRLAFRDGLTGLYNHRSFQEMLEKELSRAQRYKRQLSLVMLDIDHFKKINDIYGHLQGDLVLKVIASKLESSLRKSSFIARYGGEEFALILPEADGGSAMVVAERCRRAVEQMTIQAGNHTIRATISLGATTYSPGIQVKDKTELIQAADRALYNSKKTGRNKTSFTALTESPGSPTGEPA